MPGHGVAPGGRGRGPGGPALRLLRRPPEAGPPRAGQHPPALPDLPPRQLRGPQRLPQGRPEDLPAVRQELPGPGRRARVHRPLRGGEDPPGRGRHPGAHRKKRAFCLFYDFRELIREIQSTFTPESTLSESDVLAPVFQSDVLVLDELGAKRTTAWVEETVFYIINHRYNHKKMTLFTTNYPDTDARGGHPGLVLQEGRRDARRPHRRPPPVADLRDVQGRRDGGRRLPQDGQAGQLPVLAHS
jgi:hypothetical protein